MSTKEGDRWYIFAYKNDNNKFVAGLCGRSVNLDKKFRIKDYGLKYAYLHKKNWKKDFSDKLLKYVLLLPLLQLL